MQLSTGCWTAIPTTPTCSSRSTFTTFAGGDGDDAEQSLDLALEVAEGNPRALLCRALVRLREGGEANLREAEDDLKRIVDPEAVQQETEIRSQAFLVLAQLLNQTNRSEEAIEILEDAYEQLETSTDLGLRLADNLIADGQLERAERLLEELNARTLRMGPTVSAGEIARLQNELRLLHASLDLARQRYRQALERLSVAQSTANSYPDFNWARSQRLRADELLARIHTTTQAFELAAQEWKELADAYVLKNESVAADESLASESDPESDWHSQSNSEMARVNAGENFARSQDYLQARAQFEQLLEHASASTPRDLVRAAELGRLQAMLGLQLRRPPAERIWTEFQQQLADQKEKHPDRWQLALLEFDFLVASADREQAIVLLNNADGKFADDLDWNRAALRAYLRLRLLDDAHRLAARIKNEHAADLSPGEAGRIDAQILAAAGEYAKADAILERALEGETGDASRSLQIARIELAIAAEQPEEARTMAAKLARALTDDADVQILAAEVALQTNVPEKAREFEDALLRIQGESFQWRLLKVRRLLAYRSSTEQTELARLVSQLREERPRWYPGQALAARYYEQQQRPEDAIRYYRRAIDLGDQRITTIERLALLLYRAGDYAEAEQLLALIPDTASSPQADELAISLSVRQGRLDEALQRAEQARSRDPADPVPGIWQASLLDKSGQAEQAEQIFRELIAQFPADVRVQTAWFAFLVKSGRNAEAEDTLPSVLACVPDGEDKAGERQYIAGQCYEQLKKLDAARASYEQAVKAAPENLDFRRRFARLLMAVDLAAARAQFQEIVAQAPNDKASKQQLARLLASTGDESDWQQATSLMDGIGEDATDDRLRAVLLSRRGVNRRERIENLHTALDIMEDLVLRTAPAVPDNDRILLASLLEQLAVLDSDAVLDSKDARLEVARLKDARLDAAESQLRALVDRLNPPPFNFGVYIEFLLKHATPRSFESSSARSKRYLDLAEEQLERLERQLGREGESEAFKALSLRCKFLKSSGKQEEIAEEVDEVKEKILATAENESSQAQIYLLIGNLYAGLEMHEDAEHCYEQLAELNPRLGSILSAASMAEQGKLDDAIQTVLDVNTDEDAVVPTMVAQLLTTAEHSDSEYQAVEPLLSQAIQKYSGDANLLMAVAALQVRRGNDEAAIGLYEQVAKNDPENVVALNNLATLLAEQPGRSDEAKDLTERAMAIVGRQPALLDTLGTILLMDNDPNAVACLEEATAGIVDDPRVYLHLSAAYANAKRKEEATKALRNAFAQGLSSTLLTGNDAQLMKTLARQLGLEDELTTSTAAEPNKTE